MNLCPICRQLVRSDAAYCPHCGARQPHFWLPEGDGAVETTFGTYVKEAQRPDALTLLAERVADAVLRLRFDGDNPPLHASGAPFCYVVEIERPDGGETLWRFTRRDLAHDWLRQKSGELAAAHRAAVQALDVHPWIVSVGAQMDAHLAKVRAA